MSSVIVKWRENGGLECMITACFTIGSDLHAWSHNRNCHWTSTDSGVMHIDDKAKPSELREKFSLNDFDGKDDVFSWGFRRDVRGKRVIQKRGYSTVELFCDGHPRGRKSNPSRQAVSYYRLPLTQLWLYSRQWPIAKRPLIMLIGVVVIGKFNFITQLYSCAMLAAQISKQQTHCNK